MVMPPHITRLENISNGVLEEPCLIIHGYSLGLIDLKKEIHVVEKLTQNAVSFETNLVTTSERRGKSAATDREPDAVGTRQQKCVLTIVFADLKEDCAYLIDAFGDQFEFVYRQKNG